MLTSAVRRSLRALPKVHLHVHLEGTIRPSTLLELAVKHGLEPPDGLRDGSYRFLDLAGFFVQYQRVRECLRDADDFRRVAFELCQDETAEGVRYAEVTFTPAFHALRLGDWEMPLASIVEGFALGEQEFGIRCRLVLDHSRRRPLELAERTLELALRYRDDGVVALGLGGPEAGFPPEPYARVFEMAVHGGLHSVPHAGEEAGPSSIRGALHALRAERLGHGVRVLEDPDLVAEVRERRIPLEVCPSINVTTGVFASIAEHALPRLIEAGLVVTLNADVPGMIATPIGREYEIARDTFGLSDRTLADIARAGVRAAFLGADHRAALEREIDDWLTGAVVTIESPAT
jgi:adenosine deaminase